jgi:hypothetical protein
MYKKNKTHKAAKKTPSLFGGLEDANMSVGVIDACDVEFG